MHDPSKVSRDSLAARKLFVGFTARRIHLHPTLELFRVVPVLSPAVNMNIESYGSVRPTLLIFTSAS